MAEVSILLNAGTEPVMVHACRCCDQLLAYTHNLRERDSCLSCVLLRPPRPAGPDSFSLQHLLLPLTSTSQPSEDWNAVQEDVKLTICPPTLLCPILVYVWVHVHMCLRKCWYRVYNTHLHCHAALYFLALHILHTKLAQNAEDKSQLLWQL